MKERCWEHVVETPVREDRRPLRLSRKLFVGDDDLARDRIVTMVDPELPIQLLLDEGDMIAVHSADVIYAHILAALNLRIDPFARMAEIEALERNR